MKGQSSFRKFSFVSNHVIFEGDERPRERIGQGGKTTMSIGSGGEETSPGNVTRETRRTGATYVIRETLKTIGVGEIHDGGCGAREATPTTA